MDSFLVIDLNLAGLLGGFGRAIQNAEDIVLAHDEVLLTVDLNFGTAVLRDEDFIANFDVEFDLLAVVVELASADGGNGTFLRLLSRRVGTTTVQSVPCNNDHEHLLRIPKRSHDPRPEPWT